MIIYLRIIEITTIAVFKNFIDFRETGREGRREREPDKEREVCCSTYLCTHWLILVCALTKDQICKLGM